MTPKYEKATTGYYNTRCGSILEYINSVTMRNLLKQALKQLQNIYYTLFYLCLYDGLNHFCLILRHYYR